jgi:hypothetical protein
MSWVRQYYYSASVETFKIGTDWSADVVQTKTSWF